MFKRKSLITVNDPKAAASEAYRMVRTNIEFSNVDEKKQTIVFTSPRQKEGKSTTIANTAIAMAQSGSKVLIIDCDLRKPRVHKLFRLSNEEGIVNVITSNKDIDDVIHHSDDLENLDIITSGPIPPMPSELLGSKKFEEILEKLKETYDYIFMDSPPVLSVTDSTVLAAKVDGTILVISFGDTTVDAAQTAKKSLERVGAKMLGVVLTKAKVNKSGYYYYYHYDYEYSENQVKEEKEEKAC